jgi:hypothetical protein
MEKFKIPSFDSLPYGEETSWTTCSPHLTFTTNGFFNPPHIDSKDTSPFSFVLFLPTYSSDGHKRNYSTGTQTWERANSRCLLYH